VQDVGSEAATLVNLGLVLYDQGDLHQSKEALEHALRIARDRESPAIEAAALYTLALLEYRQGNHEIAKRTALEVLELIDSDEQRRLINQTEDSYLAARNGIYDLLMELSIARPVEKTSRQDFIQAFEISESGRRRRLLEGVSSLQQRFDALAEDSSGLQEERLRLESVLGDLRNKKQRLGGDEKSTSVTVKEVLEELATIDARIQISHPWYSMAKRPTPVVLEEALELLDDDTALIVYELMTDRSIAFVLTKNSQEIYELPPAAELQEDVKIFFESVSTNPGSRRHRWRADIAKKLSKALMPFSDKLGSSRLIIVPDGVLQEVPFAALPDPNGGGFLFQRHKVSLLPSVSVLRAIRQIVANRKAPDGALAMFSVSDFPQGGWEPLSHSREEAEGIRDHIDKTEVPPFVAFDDTANKEAVTSGRLKGFRIIHFATHASNHPKHPELSKIILYDGELTVREIQNLDLRAELVVLSACETAQGVEVVGEGQVGLAHAFIYAGAARVVASLWKVDDEGTSQFMQRFYYEMSKEGGDLAPAEALRAAQKWMSDQARWRSPYYWAGFQLIGEWR
jgi:CHAT domain-containing protein